jgi:hypothetical protein
MEIFPVEPTKVSNALKSKTVNRRWLGTIFRTSIFSLLSKNESRLIKSSVYLSVCVWVSH